MAAWLSGNALVLINVVFGLGLVLPLLVLVVNTVTKITKTVQY